MYLLNSRVNLLNSRVNLENVPYSGGLERVRDKGGERAKKCERKSCVPVEGYEAVADQQRTQAEQPILCCAWRPPAHRTQ
jgi:hypothetical protein